VTPELFVGLIALLVGGFYHWAFRVLPGERWQVAAAHPTSRGADGRWRGVNLTWYGIFSASAYALAAALGVVLFAAVGVPLAGTAALLAALLAVCMPAAKVIARIVERRRGTLTVGGAAFVGMVLAPFVVLGFNATAGRALGFAVPVLPGIAVLSIAYAFGEGFGRVACISFGCCYGMPLAGAPRWVRALVGRRAFVFHGATKKVAYASGLEGQPVVPVQAVTAVLYTAVALAASWLFLRGQFATSMLLAAVTTQGWRAFSETLRADYRGAGKVSVYQVMAGLGAAYAVGAAVVLHHASAAGVVPAPQLGAGLAALWSPAAILVLQSLWVVSFLFSGVSTVTGATMEFFHRPPQPLHPLTPLP
jgi:hypothetical protein